MRDVSILACTQHFDHICNLQIPYLLGYLTVFVRVSKDLDYLYQSYEIQS